MLGLLLKGAADEPCELVDLAVRVRVDRLKVTLYSGVIRE